jgi:hypothetical protein
MPQEYRPVLVKGCSLREFSDVPYYIENFKVDENGRLVATKSDLIDSARIVIPHAYGMWAIVNAFYTYDSSSPNYRKVIVDAIGVRLKLNNDGKYVWDCPNSDDGNCQNPYIVRGDKLCYKITNLKQVSEGDFVTVDVDNYQICETGVDLYKTEGSFTYLNNDILLHKLYGDVLLEQDTGNVYSYDIVTGNKVLVYSGTQLTRCHEVHTCTGVFVYRNDAINKKLILNDICYEPDPNCTVKYNYIIVDVFDYQYNENTGETQLSLAITGHRVNGGSDNIDIPTITGFHLSFDELLGFSLKQYGYIMAFESRYWGALIYDSETETLTPVSDLIGQYLDGYSYKVRHVAYRDTRDELIVIGVAQDSNYRGYLFVYVRRGSNEKLRKVEIPAFYGDIYPPYVVSPLFRDSDHIELMVYYPYTIHPGEYIRRDSNFMVYFYEVKLFNFFNNDDDSYYFTRSPSDNDYYALANYDATKYTEPYSGEPEQLYYHGLYGDHDMYLEFQEIIEERFYFKFFDYYVGKYGILRKYGNIYDYVLSANFNFTNPKVLNLSGKYYVVDGNNTFVFTPHYLYKLSSHPTFHLENNSGEDIVTIYTRLRVYVSYPDGYEAYEIFPYYEQRVNLSSDPRSTYSDNDIVFGFIDIPSTLDAQADLVMYVTDNDPATPDYWGRFVHPTTGKGVGIYGIDEYGWLGISQNSLVALEFAGVRNYCTDQVDTYGVLPPMEYKQINEHSIFFQNRILVPQKNKIYYSDVNNPHCFNSTYLYLGFNEQSDIVALYGKANTLLIGFENGAVYVARGILPDWYVDSDGLVRMPEFQIKKLPFYFPNLKMLLIHTNVYYAICEDKIYAFDDDGYKMLFDLTPKLPVEVKSDGTWTLSLEPLGGRIFEVSEEYENAVYIPIVRNINGSKKVGFIKFAPYTNALYIITSDLDYDSSKSHILYYAFDPYNRCVIVNNGDYIAFLSKGNGNKDNIVSIYLPPFYSLFLQKVLFDGKAITGKSSINLMVSNDPSNSFNFKSYSYPNVSMEEFRKIIKTNLKGKYIGVTLKNLEYLNSISLIWNSVAKRNETTQ